MIEDGRNWRRTSPCVAIEEWPVRPAADDAAFTAVTSWYGNEWIDDEGTPRRNDKRSGYLPFLDLPSRVDVPLELAVDLADDPEDERSSLTSKGWRVVDGRQAASSLDGYRSYVASSLGEFGCAKPFYVQHSTGWLSDRSACYLASGKPVVVQDTGSNPLLDEAGGLFRFRDVDEAARSLQSCMLDYERHCKEARAFAEAHLDAREVVRKVIEQTI
jgi:hypothetical protein